MKNLRITVPPRPAIAVLAAFVACAALPAAAQTSEVEQVRSTTQKLINLLVEQGVITRSRAEALLKEVEAPAPSPAPAAPAAAAAPADKASAPVRVPYVPEFVRKELKEELRSEMAAQALREGWADPKNTPAWIRNIRVEGDLRTRFQFDDYASDNALDYVNVLATNASRTQLQLLNTTEDRSRLRVRARVGVATKVDEDWSGGIRLTTGSTSDPLSSNQTLGTYGNRFTVAFDRAYIRYAYYDQFSVVAGRFGNPWFGTDLVWASDLSFDGVALQWLPRVAGQRAFFTLAAMPIQEVELAPHDKWLFGAQVGADLRGPGIVSGKLGLGYYHYQNIVGVRNPTSGLINQNDYTAPAFAQKGNTYFNIATDTSKPLLLALASDYHIVNLTGTMAVETVGGRQLVLTGDWAKNLGFDRTAVAERVGTDVEPKTNAYALRVAYGHADVHARGEWQGFFSYKHVERDAVLDAFTDSDLRLGGTDVKGYVLGASLGLGKNTVGTLRWLSGQSISGAPLSIDTLQADLSMRF